MGVPCTHSFCVMSMPENEAGPVPRKQGHPFYTSAPMITSPRKIRPLMMTMSNDVLFEIKDLEVSYGSIAAIKGISLEVHKGEIVQCAAEYKCSNKCYC